MADVSGSCCIKGCEGPIHGVGFCAKHYYRWHGRGHPLAGELEGYSRQRTPGAKERTAWAGAKRRCYSVTHRQYAYYGGRGIRMCDRWLLRFDHFLEDMGPAPGPEFTLERINVNGHYEPANCRWATTLEQNRNLRSTRLTAKSVEEAHRRIAAGENVAQIARDFGVKYNTLYQAVNGTSWVDLKPEGRG